MTGPTRRADCRYCRRYSRACGRPHTEATRPDWGRSETGPSAASRLREITTTTPKESR